jgi:outer membrane protein assembly factor BamB
MIRRGLIVRLAAVAVLAMGASACGGIKTPKIPFMKSKPKYSNPGQRIPVLALNQQMTPSDALKGADFALPEPTAVAAWPQASGPTDAAFGNIQAGPNFQIEWRKKIGAAENRRAHITSPPVVVGDRVYVLDGKGTVSARSASTGSEIWSQDLEPRKGRDREGYGGGVAVAGGQVFVTSGYRFVAALDANSGAVKWKVDTATPLHSAPTVAGNLVYTVDVANEMVAYDQATGAPAWTYQGLEEPARILASSSPTVSGDVIVTPFSSGELVALRAPNGQDLWMDVLSFSSRNNALSEIRDIPGHPVIDRGTVYAGSHSGVFVAIDLRDGQRRWSLPITTITSPWVAGDVVYVTSQTGEVICIARESGQIYWIVDLNKGVSRKKRPIWSGPALASNQLVLFSSKGQAIALNPKTGATLKTLKLGGGSVIQPVAANGRIYGLTDKAELISIR